VENMGNLHSYLGYGKTVKEVVPVWEDDISADDITNPVVQLFFKGQRNIPCIDYKSFDDRKSLKERYFNSVGVSYIDKNAESIESLFDKAWDEDPLLTLRFVFFLRDKEGRGEKKLFRALIRHMRERELTEHIRKNLELFPYYGTWKDIMLCCFGTELEGDAVILIAEQLKDDIEMLQTNGKEYSVCAKYAPSEGKSLDIKHHAVAKIAHHLEVSLKQYRKDYLVPLRQALHIVEKDMCNDTFEKIDYATVPYKALKNYMHTFLSRTKQPDLVKRYYEMTKNNSSLFSYAIAMLLLDCTKDYFPNGSKIIPIVKDVNDISIGMSTYLSKQNNDIVFHEGTVSDILHKLLNTKHMIPEVLLVFQHELFEDLWELKATYREHTCPFPKVIYWDTLCKHVSFEFVNKNFVIHGVDETIINSFLTGAIPSPKNIAFKALNNDRYRLIELAK
jgi:hypothetical protein